MLMEGPKGRLAYEGWGKFIVSKKPLAAPKKRIGLVSGGTGITPCYQVLQAALNGEDGTNLKLVFANKTVNDILLKEELLQLAANNKERFNLYLTVDIKPEDPNWKGGVGFVTKEVLQAQMPAPSPDTIILFCGPPPFEDMLKKFFKELGYADDMLFKF